MRDPSDKAEENSQPGDAPAQANPGGLEQADVELGKELARHRDNPAVKMAGQASKIGDQEPLYVIAAAVVLGGLFARDRRLAGTGAALLAALGAADATKSLTKSLVKRTRPHVFLDENRYETGAGGSEQKPDQSFPSGHMAGSVAFARALSRTYPKAGALCGLASLILGWSRIAKGAHWPLDVVGGGAIGLLSEAITSRVLPVSAQCRSAFKKIDGGDASRTVVITASYPETQKAGVATRLNRR